MAATKSLGVAMLVNILWGAGSLFAISFALLGSGTMVLVLMCLLMLADSSQNGGGVA
jgi:hypothetical protein